MVKFKLKNLELVGNFETVHKSIQDMSETIGKLQEFFSTDTNKARVIVTTSNMEQRHTIKGIADADGKCLVNKHLKRRAKDTSYQALNKTPEMKKLTNNFNMSASYKDIFIAVFGTDSPITMVDDQLFYKAVSYDIIDGEYIIEIEKRDINEHTLKNFEEIL